MKKYLILPLIFLFILTACSKDPFSKTENELVNKFILQEDLDSYLLNFESRTNLPFSPKEAHIEGTISINKKENIKHVKYMDSEEGVELEEYLTDEIRLTRLNKEAWKKDDLYLKENDEDGEKKIFLAKNNIGSDEIFKILKDYFIIQDGQNTCLCKFESDDKYLSEIQNVLGDSISGKIDYLRAEFSFDKSSYYPISYDWEIKFTDRDNKQCEIAYRGDYEKVNEGQSIEIPKEVKDLIPITN